MSVVESGPMTDVVRASVERFRAWLERGAGEGLFAPDVFADVTLPHWRVQTSTREEILAARARLHPQPGRTRLEKVLAGPGGYALKIEERWEDGGRQWYCRESFLCELDEAGLVTALDVYCTGDWDEARVAEHAAQVPLIRP